MILKESNSREWFKEVSKRFERVKAALVLDKMELAEDEARELMAASRIMWEEIIMEMPK